MAKSPLTAKPVPLTHTMCCDITRPDATLNIELWGEQTNAQKQTASTACLGSLRLTVGELFEGDLPHDKARGNNATGLGVPTNARRFWLPLSNIPIEIDRTCTHHELVMLKTKSGQKTMMSAEDDEDSGMQYLYDPRGLFVCFETNVVLSQAKLFFNNLLSVEHMHNTLTTPQSAYNAMELCLPPSLCQEPNKLLELAHPAKDPALCTKVGQLAMTLTGATADTTNQDDMAQATSNLSAHLFIRNIVRFFFAINPLLEMCNVVYDLFSWKSTIHTLFTIFMWIFVCYNPIFILPLLAMFTVYTITMNVAEYHFLQAAQRANTTYARAVKQRYQLSFRYVEQLHNTIIPTLSPRAQAMGVLIQVITGRLATLLERFNSLFYWTNVNDNALTVGIIATITTMYSAYAIISTFLLENNTADLLADVTTTTTTTTTPTLVVPTLLTLSTPTSHSGTLQIVAAIIPVILCLSWNSSFMFRLKHLAGACFRTRAHVLHIRRESKTARLLTSEPKD